MDRTQVGLGLGILGLGVLTLTGSMVFQPGAVETPFAVGVSVVAAGALLLGLTRSQRTGRVRART